MVKIIYIMTKIYNRGFPLVYYPGEALSEDEAKMNFMKILLVFQLLTIVSSLFKDFEFNLQANLNSMTNKNENVRSTDTTTSRNYAEKTLQELRGGVITEIIWFLLFMQYFKSCENPEGFVPRHNHNHADLQRKDNFNLNKNTPLKPGASFRRRSSYHGPSGLEYAKTEEQRNQPSVEDIEIREECCRIKVLAGAKGTVENSEYIYEDVGLNINLRVGQISKKLPTKASFYNLPTNENGRVPRTLENKRQFMRSIKTDLLGPEQIWIEGTYQGILQDDKECVGKKECIGLSKRGYRAIMVYNSSTQTLTVIRPDTGNYVTTSRPLNENEKTELFTTKNFIDSSKTYKGQIIPLEDAPYINNVIIRNESKNENK
jgi:hypothetical protein